MKLLIFVLLAGGLSACNWLSSKPQVQHEVEVIEPKISAQPFVLHYIGVVKSVQNVNVKARVDGYLQERFFKDGDFIQKDQLLYRIDKRPYEAELQATQGALDKAKAQLAFQELQLHRYETMLAKKAVSKSAFDQQYSTYLSAKAQVELTEGNVKKAKINLDFCEIRSPLDGLAGKNLVDPGNLVSLAAQPILVNIVQLDPIRVEFSPATADLKWYYQFKNYNPFKVEVHIPQFHDEAWRGKIDFYNNVISSNTGTILVRANLENKPLFLRPDLYVDVDVILNPNYSFTWVPVTLVQSRQGLFQIQVVDASHHLALRQLELGDVKEGKIQVLSGLKPGDLIVTQTSILPLGSLVKPKKIL